MHYRAIPALLTLAVLAVGASSVLAAEETKPATKPSASAQAKAAPKAKEPKPVDINTASVEQLAEVPGLDKAHAMKIVSNRPYPTRAWLVTKGILSEAKYAEVKDHLVATPNTSPRAPSKK
jgi:DNA uptake protein ComE-like DNA-binding protein